MSAGLSHTVQCSMRAEMPPAASVRLSVGGSVFILPPRLEQTEGLETNLHKFLAAEHSQRVAWSGGFSDERREYDFSRRCGRVFACVVSWVLGDEAAVLHAPTDVCRTRLATELAFWGISPEHLSECCSQPPLPEVPRTDHFVPSEHLAGTGAGPVTRKHTTETLMDLAALEAEHDAFKGVACSMRRRRLWETLENPMSCRVGKLFALTSVVFIVVSLVGLVLGSMPALQVPATGEPVGWVLYLEYASIAWFTFEYTLRFLITPQKCAYVKAPLNVIDLITILPFFVELAASAAADDAAATESVSKFKGMLLVMRILRVLRVMRLFKLARYSSGLQSFGVTVKHSIHELAMLGLFLLTAIIFFSTIMYFLEKDEPDTPFNSIPASAWWCVITMTTVGYGDLVPLTIGGKCVAAVASISGVLVLAFPITMIVDNFAQHFQKAPSTPGSARRPPKFS